MTSAAIDLPGLSGIHDLVRSLLAELDRAAGEIGLDYYLAYGTAIGAVREHNLIAWDVDADVWVRHDQRELLLRALPQVLGPDFELLSTETHNDYEFLFPRLVLRRIHHLYVRVDIFPLDPAPRSPRLRLPYLRLMRLLDRAHFVKRADPVIRRHYSPRKRLVTRLLRTALLPVPAALLQAVFRRLQSSGAATTLINSCGSYGQGEIFDAAWFEGAERVPVGDRSLPVPVGYDNVLSQLYGDYRTPVSAEQQRRELEAATSSFVEPLRAAGLLPNVRGDE